MVGLVTNGQLLTPEHLEKLVDLELDELTPPTSSWRCSINWKPSRGGGGRFTRNCA
jgi:hypothetical protein